MTQLSPTRRPEKQVRLKTLLIWGLGASLVVVWLVLWQGDALVDWISRPAIERARAASAEDTGAAESDPIAAAAAAAAARPRREAARMAWTKMLGTEPVWPTDFASPRDCAAVDREFETLCRTLDGREGVRRGLTAPGTSSGASGGTAPAAPESSCTVIRRVAEQLAARPPRLESELRSLESILSNVFHLSRTLTPDKARQLRDVMNGEPELQEATAMTLYRWAASRERCATGGTAMRLEALYDYAGFLTQTMGGQAYLRRRSPEIEALATFYALVMLDGAVQAGTNPHGIDIRPDLDRCRRMLAAQPLVFGDRYVETLDAIARRWDRK